MGKLEASKKPRGQQEASKRPARGKEAKRPARSQEAARGQQEAMKKHQMGGTPRNTETIEKQAFS